MMMLKKKMRIVMKNNLLPIAKEGWKYIGFSLLAFVFFAVVNLELLSAVSFILAAFFIFIFRNPERELPRFEQNSVMSPVDGTVLSIDEISDSEYAYKVTIDSTYLNTAILRSPVSGIVHSLEKEYGAKLGLDTKLASKLNENVAITFEDVNANRVKISHMLKQSFQEIRIDAVESKNMLQTSRYGVMVNGVSTIYLPQNFRLNITVADEIKASETLVGYFS